MLTGNYINIYDCTAGNSKIETIQQYIEQYFDYYKYENGKHTFKTKGFFCVNLLISLNAKYIKNFVI